MPLWVHPVAEGGRDVETGEVEICGDGGVRGGRRTVASVPSSRSGLPEVVVMRPPVSVPLASIVKRIMAFPSFFPERTCGG
jgi:hypothetical protein